MMQNLRSCSSKMPYARLMNHVANQMNHVRMEMSCEVVFDFQREIICGEYPIIATTPTSEYKKPMMLIMFTFFFKRIILLHLFTPVMCS